MIRYAMQWEAQLVTQDVGNQLRMANRAREAAAASLATRTEEVIKWSINKVNFYL